MLDLRRRLHALFFIQFLTKKVAETATGITRFCHSLLFYFTCFSKRMQEVIFDKKSIFYSSFLSFWRIAPKTHRILILVLAVAVPALI